MAIRTPTQARSALPAHDTAHGRQELLTRIVETVTDGIYVVDRDGRMSFANTAAERILGLTREQIGEHSFNDAIWEFTTLDGDPFPEDQQPFAQVMRTGQPLYGVKQCCRRPDGSRIIASINAAPLRDAAGVIVGEVATMTDITKQVEEVRRREASEEALRRSVATNRALLNAIPDLMLRIADGHVVNFKAGRQGCAGVLSEEPQGKPLSALLPAGVAEEAYARVAQALETHDTQVFEYQVTDRRGVHDFEARVVVSGDREVLAIIRDISERKAADRLKNEFISTVSHELRTPLTSILGSLGLVTGGVAGEIAPPARAMLEIAQKNSERLVRLINDILDIEKIESGKMAFRIEPMELMPLIEHAIEANRTYAEPFGVRFVLEHVLPGAVVRVDGDRLTQVLTNLLSNAAKFSPQGGVVTVAAARCGDQVRVSIRDTGPGIPATFRERIFQKFAQADSSDTRKKGGTGLGLSISKAIVERLGGQIAFDTVEGAGTTFYFDLPEVPADDRVSATAAGSKAPRLLVCDDDADIATLLRMMLEQAGFAVDVAHDAAQVKRLLAERAYAGMTLDLRLPDQDGISLIRELRARDRTRALPIVVVSVKAAEGKAELNGDAFLVADWISKPIDHDRLIAAVCEAVSAHPGRDLRILHIEDDPDIVQVVAAILKDMASIECAASVEEARAKVNGARYDLAILDLALPDGSGLDLLPVLRKQSPPVPVVVFSAHEVRSDMAHYVAASLVKARATNQDVIETIRACVTRSE